MVFELPKELEGGLRRGELNVLSGRPEKKHKYEAGETLTINRETFTLVERVDTYPTKGNWALARWKVEFKDHYDRVIGGDFYRAVREIGVPNEHFPEKIEGMDYVPKDEDGNDVEMGAIRSNKQDGRGRPEGPMNELKARNIFRDIVKGTKPYNQAKIDEATEFLKELGDDKFINKYIEKINKNKAETLV